MTQEEKRLQRLQLLDDHIGRALRASEASGELEAAPSWGKPLDFGDGYEQTPPELRMGLKILKDAGIVPPEVEMMRALAGLRSELDAAAGDATRERSLRGRIAAMQLAIDLRRDALRREIRRARDRL
jgi:DNA-binding transcriptional ArsR family regulator